MTMAGGAMVMKSRPATARADLITGSNGATADHARILDALEVGVIVHDAALRIVYTNGAAAALLGVEVAEALKRDVADPLWVVIYPDGSPVPPHEVPASLALSTGKAVRGMILGVRQRDGVTTWLAVDGVPLTGASGAVDFVAVTIVDVTRELVARLQLEGVRDTLGRTIQERDAALGRAVEALESSEARYRAVLRSMSEGVAVHGPGGAILFANPAAQRILGLTLEQMRGQHPVEPAWRLTDPSGEPLLPELIPSEITRRTGVPQRNTLLGVVRGNSLERAWLSVSTDPIDTAGKPAPDGGYSVVATFQDITGERRALEEAQRARDHLNDIAAALPGVVAEYLLHTDGSLRFQYLSEPVRKYFGVDPEHALRDSSAILSRVHPADREGLIASLRKAAATDSSLELDVRTLHPDGHYRHARLHSRPPTPVPEGHLFRTVVFDVTDQRRLEETVREAQRREVMGRLAAGLAHNFNNMLAVIVPSLDMIGQEVPERARADLEDARIAAHAATELVRQLMQLVRKDTPAGAAPVDVAALVQEVSHLCRRTFEPTIEIHCEVPATPCFVLARRAELQQVVVNLCINARDALAGRPAPRLELGVAARPEQVVVWVADNGAGMPPEVQRRLGEPFFTTKPPGQGTGLGLATAYGIVADLQGSIQCTSQRGEGTRFELSLPREHAKSSAGSTSSPVQSAARGLRVLLVDDEELVRNTLSRSIARFGAEVLCASRGSEALALLGDNPDIGLVLLDLAMPEMDGAEVLRQIRNKDSSLPVYLMTGFLRAGLELDGASGVLTKPIDMAELNALLARAGRERG